ncbi:sensor histidine kinase [Sphingopyxis sp. GC21]|uniref:sensor histidine kinase n=1 Tax=Sphingopyxis sp. GC21 TaxID=2933562 RepID=UPI0021E38090|nr:HAMP domain-containing sensor histidine kinase [Sphingopyxis sp. GC21]
MSSRLLRSTLFRVSALNALLLVISMAAGAVGGWLATRGIVERQARSRVELESDTIALEFQRSGLDRAIEMIRSKAKRPGALEYYLIDPRGRTVIGDLEIVPREAGWHFVEEPSSQPGVEGAHLVALTRRLPDTSLLMVGEDMERSDAIRDAVFGAILLAGGTALAFGIFAGLLATRRTLRQMQRISASVRAVENGDLSARIGGPVEARTDLDDLALTIDGMLDRIDTLVATVRRVSAEVAHDLRTPLTRVRHAIEIALAQPDAGLRTAALEQAMAGLDEALRLFSAVLDLAEIDAGRARAQFTQVDVAEVVDRVVDCYRAEIEASSRQISVDLAGEAVVAGDADLLARALANLIENALKYSHDAARIDVSVKAQGDVVTMAVADDGPGVSDNEVAEMLRPFGRLDRARSESGNGLGLAIADAVARLHRGTLLFAQVQPGLAVEIRIPRSTVAWADSEVPRFD